MSRYNAPVMKKLVLVTALVSLALLAAKPVYAEDQTCVQVPVYGGGVGTVCGAKTHEPINTAFEGITPAMVGGALVGASGVLAYFARKVRSQKSA